MLKIYQMCIRPLLEDAVFEEKLKQVNAKRREKALRYRSKEDRCRSLAAGLLIREGLLREGISYETAQFGDTEYGKPFLKDGAVHFNCSHSGDYAVAVFCSREVGIDVEHGARLLGEKGQTQMQRIAGRAFTANEREQLANRKGDARRREFLRLWTCKESYAKAAGLGLRMELSRIDTAKTGYFYTETIENDYVASVCTLEEPEIFSDCRTERIIVK